MAPVKDLADQSPKSSPNSVATVMTDVFQKNGIMVSRKLAKIMRIFVDMGCIKNQGVSLVPIRL
jgi:hypothetical protein